VNILQIKYGLRNIRTFAHVGAMSMSTDGVNVLSVAKDPSVAYVQEEGVKRINAVDWGLDRLDQRALPLDQAFNPDGDGAGVHIVSIDTGVSAVPDFGTRLQTECFSAVLDGFGCSDGNGHGTHTMGTAAGSIWGVAKKAFIHAARVLDSDGSGSDSDVIAGIEFATQIKQDHPTWDVVANVSLGGDPAPALDAAVCTSIASGITYAIAGGNEGAPAYTSSPARVRQAITVAASDRTDKLPSWSNYGLPTDIVAPGVDIISDQPGGGAVSESGTSMATPHVVGVAALYLQKHPGATPAQVEAALVASATHGALQGTLKPNTPNLLLSVLGF
jgi:subtilisin family serine protease